MKKVKYISIVFLLFFSSCSILSSNYSDITVSASLNRSFTSEDIKNIVLEVTGPGMGDIKVESTGSFIQTSVKYGDNRKFTLTVNMNNGIVLEGSTIADIHSKSVNIDIGLANINTIVDLGIGITDSISIPLEVTIGISSTVLSLGSSLTATASLPKGETGVSFKWYIGDQEVGSGSSITLGSSFSSGSYELLCVATGENSRGTASAKFSIGDLYSPLPHEFLFIEKQASGTERKISWSKAVDNLTPDYNLEYKVDIYTSTLESTPVTSLNWSKETYSHTITGLDGATDYFIRVYVRDEAGNEAKLVHNPVCVYLGASPNGNGSRSKPYILLADAYKEAYLVGAKEVWVGHSGITTYNLTEPLKLIDGISINGGFSSSFDVTTSLPEDNDTIIKLTAGTHPLNGSYLSVIYCDSTITVETKLENLAVGGYEDTLSGENKTAIHIDGGSPILRNIRADANGKLGASSAHAILAENSGAPKVYDSYFTAAADSDIMIKVNSGGVDESNYVLFNRSSFFIESAVTANKVVVSYSNSFIVLSENFFREIAIPNYGTTMIEIGSQSGKLNEIHGNTFVTNGGGDFYYTAIEEATADADPTILTANSFPAPGTRINLYINEGSDIIPDLTTILNPEGKTLSELGNL